MKIPGADGSGRENGDGYVFSSSLPARSSAQSQGMEAHSETVSSAPGEGSELVLSSSEEGDNASTERDASVDLPP